MSYDSATITIAIPTYNRVEAVTQRIAELTRLDDSVHILVIDNASTDGTYDALVAGFHQPNLRLLRNDTNLGYAGNLLRLADEATTPYVMFVSDEDSIDAAGLSEMIAFCAQVQPSMVSPQAQVGERRLYRGRATTAIIQPADFHSAAFYVSGVTFATAELKSSVPTVRAMLGSNSAATLYPQVLLAALAVAGGNAHFLAAHVTEQRLQLATAITDTSGGDYRTAGSRWAQHLSYEEFFNGDHAERLRAPLEEMREAQRRAIIPMMFRAMHADLPDIAPHIVAASTKIVKDSVKKRLFRR